MNKLQNSQQALEKQTLTFKQNELKASIAVAIERIGATPFDITNLTTDVLKEFRGMKLEAIQKAIRNGSLGKYGRTYKFNTQEVCIWIREYLKETNRREI